MRAAVRALLVAYFASHIPITLLIDAQAALPRSWFPAAARRLVDFHVATFHDPLMRAPPPWFRAVVGCELALQLPFFFVALRALRARDDDARDAFLAYGAHVATTLVPIYAPRGSMVLYDNATWHTRLDGTAEPSLTRRTMHAYFVSREVQSPAAAPPPPPPLARLSLTLARW